MSNSISYLQTGPLGVNTYIVPCGEEKVFIVDPGGDFEEIDRFLKKGRDGTGKYPLTPIAFVLTHGHFDHLGALPALKQAYPAALFCIHEGDGFYAGEEAYSYHREGFAAFGALHLVETVTSKFPKMPSADILFSADDKFLSFAPDWQILHTPGHSKGSICLYNEKEKTLLSGDTLFAASYGRTDLKDGSFSQLKKSLAMLLKLPPETLVCPGHEGFTAIGRERLNLGHL